MEITTLGRIAAGLTVICISILLDGDLGSFLNASGAMIVFGGGVERRGDEVVSLFPSEIAFSSRSGSLNAGVEQVLDRLARALKKTPGDLIFSGHTDNIPVREGVLQPNWDLSASRATGVVHRFLFKHQVDPKRITAEGYGDSRPIASNDTPQGQKKNRWMEVTIISLEKMAKDEAKTKKKSTSFYDE